MISTSKMQLNFFADKLFKASLIRIGITSRKERKFSPGFKSVALFVKAGDFVEVFYFFKGNLFSFDGLCLSVTRKSLLKPDVSIVIRNKIQNIWIECIFSYFYNRVYSLRIHDYKRKFFSFNRSKWLFLRNASVSSTIKKNQRYSWYLSRSY